MIIVSCQCMMCRFYTIVADRTPVFSRSYSTQDLNVISASLTIYELLTHFTYVKTGFGNARVAQGIDRLRFIIVVLCTILVHLLPFCELLALFSVATTD
jgi:hypothetical protein